MPDPYIVDRSGHNAFDELSEMTNIVRHFNDKSEEVKYLAKVQSAVFKAEIERVTSKDFEPRFTYNYKKLDTKEI